MWRPRPLGLWQGDVGGQWRNNMQFLKVNDQRVHVKKYIATPGVVLWPDQKEQRQVNSSVTDVFTLYVEKLEKNVVSSPPGLSAVTTCLLKGLVLAPVCLIFCHYVIIVRFCSDPSASPDIFILLTSCRFVMIFLYSTFFVNTLNQNVHRLPTDFLSVV